MEVIVVAVVLVYLYHSQSGGTNTSDQIGHVTYQGSLRVTSDNFNDTLLNRYSRYYKEKEKKYKYMVS